MNLLVTDSSLEVDINKQQPCKGIVIFAHGAGSPMDHQFMNEVSDLFNQCALKVVRFEFAYMHKRRVTGKKGFPDKLPVLIADFVKVVEHVLSLRENQNLPLYFAGKSMGGRVATIVAGLMSSNSLAAEVSLDLNKIMTGKKEALKGVFVYGYPFHSIKKPQALRTDHLEKIATDVYIFQGERDKLGSKEEVVNYPLGENVSVNWFKDADHDLKPRVKSGHTQKEYLKTAAQKIAKIVELKSS